MTDLERLVQLQEDERQIRNLIARLIHVADYGELDDYMRFYTEDAIWEGPKSSAETHLSVRNEGADRIRADREQRRSNGLQGTKSNIRHLNAALWIEFDGADIATAHSYFAVVRNVDGKSTVDLNGRYRDTLRRTPEGWKVSHRRVIVCG